MFYFKKMNLLSIFALFAACFALGVIGLGAFTRLMDAGLGCPDWPLCYGHVYVPHAIAVDKYKAWAEMVHRYFAGLLSILIVCVIGLSFMRSYRNRMTVLCSLALVILILYQIILGQLTVTLKLMPIIVVGHLIGGFLILSFLWLIFLTSSHEFSVMPAELRARWHPEWQLNSSGWSRPDICVYFAYIAIVLIFLQIMLGAWTSTNYAALSCPDFPFCFNDHPFFSMDFQRAFHFFTDKNLNYEGGILSDTARQTIHMSHRLGALVVTIYLFIFTLLIRIKSPVIFWIWGLLTLQIFLGIVNVTFQLPLFSAVSHTLVAAMLLLSLVTFLFQLRKRSE